MADDELVPQLAHLLAVDESQAVLRIVIARDVAEGPEDRLQMDRRHRRRLLHQAHLGDLKEVRQLDFKDYERSSYLLVLGALLLRVVAFASRLGHLVRLALGTGLKSPH
jgi:hypothetical protein